MSSATDRPGSPPASAGHAPAATPGHVPGLTTDGAKAGVAAFIGRVALLAACVDAVYLLFFLVIDSPWLAWPNLLSIAMYLTAYRLVGRRKMRAAVMLIWLEAFPHAVIGTLMTGWESGFHYLLMMFIPSVAMTNPGRQSRLFVGFLLLFLCGLDLLSRHLGPLAPIPAGSLLVLKWLNITLFVLMFSALAAYARHKITQGERRLQTLAAEDMLTGLFNRRYFESAVEQQLSRSARGTDPASLILLDIDHFKQINDHHGHEVGDQVLRHLAQLFRHKARAMDTAARWGGEEFILLAPGIHSQQAQELAERLRAAIEAEEVPTSAGPLRCTISLGLSEFRAGERLTEVFARADAALYRSKASGRNRVSVG